MIAVITPVFDDWPCWVRLIHDLDEMASSLHEPVTVVTINDGSPDAPDTMADLPPLHLHAVDIVHLHCNLGHQRAIAVGLSECVRHGDFSHIVIMDSDGEDAPGDIARLLGSIPPASGGAAVAVRAHRSEGWVFRAGYVIYKILFRGLTGRAIDFGNFCVLSMDAARRLVHMSDSWNHLAATVVKSQIPLVRVPVTRGLRYTGKTSMNPVAWTIHGLSAISVFSETVFTRLIFIAVGVCFATLGCAAVTVGLRMMTTLAIPGWATNAFGFSLVVFFEGLTLLVMLAFLTLHGRSAPAIIPAAESRRFISSTQRLHPAVIADNYGVR